MTDAIAMPLTIATLDRRGAGVTDDGAVVPFALPGESVLAMPGARGRLVEILRASPERATPICKYFGECGGCATQHMAMPMYAAWKREGVVDALRRAGVEAEVGAMVDAHGEGRRRATFHSRNGEDVVDVGFMRARAHTIVPIDSCPVLAPAMAGALDAARALANGLRSLDKPLDIVVTATMTGLDIDLRGAGPLGPAARRRLIEVAVEQDLARVSNHGDVLIERRAPRILFGSAEITPPPGGFLQATAEGERRLAACVMEAVKDARRVADLFSGSGAFALRLAAAHDVHAVEIDAAALGALERGRGGLRAISTQARDLFRHPLERTELAPFDAVVFDPPRAGAQGQASALAASEVATIVAVSCDAASFARDLNILVAGGYRIESVTPIDQFRFSPHVEIVGVLRRPRRRRSKGLLG
jgi:23S rRNA (uracil1939-C5)-methyltransferase